MLAPRRWPEAGLTLLRTFRPAGIGLRLVHELRRAADRFHFSVRHPIAVGPLNPYAFRVDAYALTSASDPAGALTRADRIASGAHHAYRAHWRSLPASPEAWLRHPLTGVIARADVPWWRISHLDPAFGDIKDLWEPARFGWAYDLVRGYIITRDDRYATSLHMRVRAWLESNPPFWGPHWSCGQETAIRAAALLYAESNLADAPSSTPEAMTRVAAVLAASGERIADAIGYALSQRNNHGISEAAGLVMLGVRFEGRLPEAAGWLNRGHALLESLVKTQFAEDGWYIQHSFTYLRVALDQLVLAERSLRAVGRGLSDASVARIRAAADLLCAVIEPKAGQVPNHGANDGAFVHPITMAEYRDFRPVLTAICALWKHPFPADLRIDDEVLAWLGLDPPPPGPSLPDGVRCGTSGWAAVRIGGTAVFLRAGRYRSRPGHIDPLHLDVRLGGKEIIVDPGTYAYNAPPPWRNGLAGARVHNGPLVDGREPGVRGPRFLWYIWPAAKLISAEWRGSEAVLVAEGTHGVRRTVRVEHDHVTIRDETARSKAGTLSVLWTLHPSADPALVRIENGEVRTTAAESNGVFGWFSPRYGERLATAAVEARRPAAAGAVVTRIGPRTGRGDEDFPPSHDVESMPEISRR